MLEPDRIPSAPAVERLTAPLTESDARAVRTLAHAATDSDAVEPLSEQPLLWLTDPEADVVHLLVRESANLVGYAQVDLGAPGSASAELVVHPDARRRGIGSALLRAIHEIAQDATRSELSIWAHGNLESAREFAQARGLVVVRELWSMGLDVAEHPVPEAQVPDGVSVRTFVVGQDEPAWLKQNARAFADHPEQGRITLSDLQAREREDWFDPAGFLLAERKGKLIGSAWTKVVDGVGEIYAVGIVPAAQGEGLGHTLTRLALNHLAGRDITDVVLYVDADNTSAVRTYEATGFTRRTVSVKYGPREN